MTVRKNLFKAFVNSKLNWNHLPHSWGPPSPGNTLFSHQPRRTHTGQEGAATTATLAFLLPESLCHPDCCYVESRWRLEKEGLEQGLELSKIQSKPCSLNYHADSFLDCRMCWRCFSKGQPRCSQDGKHPPLWHVYSIFRRKGGDRAGSATPQTASTPVTSEGAWQSTRLEMNTYALGWKCPSLSNAWWQRPLCIWHASFLSSLKHIMVNNNQCSKQINWAIIEIALPDSLRKGWKTYSSI